VQAAHPAAQAVQAVSTVGVQATVWYCPAAQVVHALQVTPSPVNPALHAQLKLPALFEHSALALQPPLLVAHSSMSMQPAAPPPV
jgi:hypothetical protein